MRFLTIFLLLAAFSSLSQSYQDEFNEAKRQYSIGNYKAARDGFKSITKSADFGPYASFYYALCSRNIGELQMASDMWKQILAKYPGWNKSEEVNFWLSYVGFEAGKYEQAFKYVDLLPEDLRANTIHTFLSTYSAEELNKVLAAYPEKEVAKYLLKKLNDEAYENRDQEAIAQLSSRFNISLSELLNIDIVQKDRYSVAVVLPFMYSSLESPQTVLKNSIVYNLYEGMTFAGKALDSLGINVNLYPYDTRKSESKTKEILLQGNLQNADLIIGPLYAKPNKVLQSFSYDRQITIINPLSSTGQVIGSNPYAYLFQPSNDTKGRQAARYAADKFEENKNAFVFFETTRDRVLADAYKSEIEKLGFNIVRFDEIDKEFAQQIQREFIEQYEYQYDTINMTKAEIDSINLIPGRFIRARSLRDKNTGRILTNEDGYELKQYYEKRFEVKPDSIGHIFLASSSNVLANNFISLAEVRPDSIGIIGYDDWLDFSLVNYQQLERIGVSMIASNYVNKENIDFMEFEQAFLNATGQKPDKYHIIGYELMMQMGNLFKAYGKNLILGLKADNYVPGIIMDGMKFGSFNDNQEVPILQLENLKLVNRNSQQ